jgi:hypothetical protein
LVIISVLADLRPSWWFIIDVVPAFRYFHYVDMDSFANILEAHAATIFSADVNKMKECLCIYGLFVQKNHCGRWGFGWDGAW